MNNDRMILYTTKWKPATYYYESLDGWEVNESGLLYNPSIDQFKIGHDNVKGVDRHLRVSIRHKLYYVSRIVAEAFVPNPNPDINTIVRHLDDDPHHNHHTNLVWGTYHENTLDGIRNRKIVYDESRKYTKGDLHANRVLDSTDVKIIISMLNESIPLKDIAAKFDVDVDVIRHIYKGTSWRCMTYPHLPFPEQQLSRKPMDPMVKEQIMLLVESNPDIMPSDIIKTLNLESSETIRGFIGSTKRKLHKI